MQLTEHHNEQQLFVRRADEAAIMVVDRLMVRSFLLTATRVVESFAPRLVSEIDDDAIEQILALRPEVVLLGTGTRATFPAPAVLAEFLRRGVGLETMDNAAAARTFNVLVGEGRHAVAAFLLPG
jgi:uncharacterized protein